MPDKREQKADMTFSELVPMRLLLNIQEGLETSPVLQEETEGVRGKF